MLNSEINLFVTTGHYWETQEPEHYKLSNLNLAIDHIFALKTNKTKMIVNTNNPFESRADINVIEETKFQYNLLWEHKKQITEFLDSDYTHFIHIEDDIEITQTTMDYWLNTKKMFEDNNLTFIPGVHRIEINDKGEEFSLDVLHTVNKNSCTKVSVADKTFVSLSQPYQGMIIFDRKLAEEHVASKYFNRGNYDGYGTPESSNLGNTYVNVPSGYSHRILTPIDNFNECWVNHNLKKYINLPNSPSCKTLSNQLFV